MITQKIDQNHPIGINIISNKIWLVYVICMCMSNCQLIVTILMKFPTPPKSYATIFL